MKHLLMALCLGLFAVSGLNVQSVHAEGHNHGHAHDMVKEKAADMEASAKDMAHDHAAEMKHDHANHDAMMHNGADLYAVLMYADWCGSCKILDPALEQAKTEHNLAEKDVLFVRMDYSNDETKKQSEMLASALGLGQIFEENNGKTGFLALIDPADMSIVSTLKKDKDSNAIGQEIIAALQ